MKTHNGSNLHSSIILPSILLGAGWRTSSTGAAVPLPLLDGFRRDRDLTLIAELVDRENGRVIIHTKALWSWHPLQGHRN